jgi:hypothetical protein
MPVSDPLIYLLILAAVFPVLWVAWWAADSAFRGSLVVKAVAPIPTAPKAPRSDYPRPVDLTLPRRRGTLVIYSRTELAETGNCRGADAAGKCPRALADGTVACAGSLLSLPAPIRGSGEWQIPFGYKVCPVASYDVYRGAASPN